MTDIRDELLGTAYIPPTDALETIVAEVAASIIGIDRIGRQDSFYDFGMGSLEAVRICARLRGQFGISAQPVWLFDTDVLSDFVTRLREAGAQTPAESP